MLDRHAVHELLRLWLSTRAVAKQLGGIAPHGALEYRVGTSFQSRVPDTSTHNKTCLSSLAFRGSRVRAVRTLSVVFVGLVLVSCDLARDSAHEEIDLIEAPIRLDSQPVVVTPPHVLPLGYDVTYLCALFPPGYREDAVRWAMLDPAGDAVQVRAELDLSDGRVMATHFAAFLLTNGSNDYYCLTPGSTEAAGDSLHTENPLTTVSTLRIWSDRPIVFNRLQWRATNAP